MKKNCKVGFSESFSTYSITMIDVMCDTTKHIIEADLVIDEEPQFCIKFLPEDTADLGDEYLDKTYLDNCLKLPMKDQQRIRKINIVYRMVNYITAKDLLKIKNDKDIAVSFVQQMSSYIKELKFLLEVPYISTNKELTTRVYYIIKKLRTFKKFILSYIISDAPALDIDITDNDPDLEEVKDILLDTSQEALIPGKINYLKNNKSVELKTNEDVEYLTNSILKTLNKDKMKSVTSLTYQSTGSELYAIIVLDKQDIILLNLQNNYSYTDESIFNVTFDSIIGTLQINFGRLSSEKLNLLIQKYQQDTKAKADLNGQQISKIIANVADEDQKDELMEEFEDKLLNKVNKTIEKPNKQNETKEDDANETESNINF